MTVQEMASRLDYKSLKRAISGEIPLPDSKRRHIQDLVQLSLVYGPKNVEPDGNTASHERLQGYIAASMLTNEEFAAKLKIKPEELGDLLKGKLHIEPKILSKAKTIAAHPPHTRERNLAPTRPLFNAPFKMQERPLHVIGWAQAGVITDYEDIVEWEEEKRIVIEDPNAFGIRIRGDSMWPPHSEGTVAVVTPGIPPHSDQLVVARLKDEGVVFKKLQIIDPVKKIFRLISYNDNYKPIERRGDAFLWIYPVRLTYNDHP